MALLHTRGKCCLILLVECLIISALTPLVSAAFASFELIDRGVEFLHRERRHFVLKFIVVVLAFLFLRLRHSRVELLVELREHIRSVLFVVLVGASFVLHVCYEDLFASGCDGSRVVVGAEVAQDACDVVSSFVFDRAYFVLIVLLMSRFCVSVFIWYCIAFVHESSW